MRHKYNVAPAADRTVDGITFASKREATRYRELKILERAGEITALELQPRYKFPMGFAYVADFRYITDRSIAVEDVKGVETPVFKLKRKCLAYFHPEVDLRIVK